MSGWEFAQRAFRILLQSIKYKKRAGAIDKIASAPFCNADSYEVVAVRVYFIERYPDLLFVFPEFESLFLLFLVICNLDFA